LFRKQGAGKGRQHFGHATDGLPSPTSLETILDQNNIVDTSKWNSATPLFGKLGIRDILALAEALPKIKVTAAPPAPGGGNPPVGPAVVGAAGAAIAASTAAESAKEKAVTARLEDDGGGGARPDLARELLDRPHDSAHRRGRSVVELGHRA